MRLSFHAGLPLSALALALACGGAPPSVASLEIDRGHLELPYRCFVPLSLSWELREPLPEGLELKVFVHLRDAEGDVVRTFDHPWTQPWRPGARVEYRLNLHQSALGPPLEPGSYGLTFGLYDGDGKRWPLAVSGEEIDRHEYRMAEVVVPVEPNGAPMYQFSPDWGESEAGSDRQVLARRWLAGPGHLRAVGLHAPGELWLRLRLPSPGPQQELVLAEDAMQQGVMIRSDCGGMEVRLAGPGNHDVQLPLPRAGEDDSCAIEIEPNFYLLELDSLARRTVSLDVLAWSAGRG